MEPTPDANKCQIHTMGMPCVLENGHGGNHRLTTGWYEYWIEFKPEDDN
jgi:hypothetical protein